MQISITEARSIIKTYNDSNGLLTTFMREFPFPNNLSAALSFTICKLLASRNKLTPEMLVQESKSIILSKKNRETLSADAKKTLEAQAAQCLEAIKTLERWREDLNHITEYNTKQTALYNAAVAEWERNTAGWGLQSSTLLKNCTTKGLSWDTLHQFCRNDHGPDWEFAGTCVGGCGFLGAGEMCSCHKTKAWLDNTYRQKMAIRPTEDQFKHLPYPNYSGDIVCQACFNDMNITDISDSAIVKEIDQTVNCLNEKVYPKLDDFAKDMGNATVDKPEEATDPDKTKKLIILGLMVVVILVIVISKK